MRKYLLDTSACLQIFRGGEIGRRMEDEYRLADPDTVACISVVTKAELLALGWKNGWGQKKFDKLNKLLQGFIILNIYVSDVRLLRAYAEIDAYCSGKHPTKKLPGSSKKLGKNDLWIASTAYTANLPLITGDKDFLPLQGVFLKIITY